MSEKKNLPQFVSTSGLENDIEMARLRLAKTRLSNALIHHAGDINDLIDIGGLTGSHIELLKRIVARCYRDSQEDGRRTAGEIDMEETLDMLKATPMSTRSAS